MRPLVLSILILAITALLHAAPVPVEKPSFDVSFRKTDDTFRHVADEKAPHFEIFSPSGISSAVIKRNSGDWPGPLTIRFAGMRMLESFHIRIGTVNLAGAINSEAMTVVQRFNDKGKPVNDPDEAVWTLTITRRDKGMEVKLETKTDLATVRELTLTWIDAYRR
jgi:hypothetical protein